MNQLIKTFFIFFFWVFTADMINHNITYIFLLVPLLYILYIITFIELKLERPL